MRDATPTTVHIAHGPITTEAPFQDCVDAMAFVQLQARAADSAGHTHFTARITADGTTIAEFAVSGHDIAGGVRAHLASRDKGLVYARVPGIDAVIYAHRSHLDDRALLIGVDADDGQRIMLAVNDADLVDTTVGTNTGSVVGSIPPHADTIAVTATVAAGTAGEARRALESAAACHPIHFRVACDADVAAR